MRILQELLHQSNEWVTAEEEKAAVIKATNEIEAIVKSQKQRIDIIMSSLTKRLDRAKMDIDTLQKSLQNGSNN